MELYPGQIVYSKAGRDKGKYFILVSKIDDNYVYIADGNMRRIEQPKKKKIKHLKITGDQIPFLVDKFNKAEKVTNSEIRKNLTVYLENQSI